jgi:hypothetical protein
MMDLLEYTDLLEDQLVHQFGLVEAQLKGKDREELTKSFERAWLRLSRIPFDPTAENNLEAYRTYLVAQLTTQVGFSGTTVPGFSFPELWRSYQLIFANLST